MRLLSLLLDSHPFWSFRAKTCLFSCFFHVLLSRSYVYNVHGHVFPIAAHIQVRYLVRCALGSCVFSLNVHVSGLLCERVVCRVSCPLPPWRSLALFFCLNAVWLRHRCFCPRVSLFFQFTVWGLLFPMGVDYFFGQARPFQVSCVLYDSPRRYATLLRPCPAGASPVLGCWALRCLHMWMFVLRMFKFLFSAS